MTQSLIQNSAANPMVFLMILTSDHISPATGVSPTVVISKNGSNFSAPVGTVTEIGNGWYQVEGNASDTDTVGPIILHATAVGCDPTDAVLDVLSATVQLGPTQTFNMIGNIQGAVGSVSNPVTCIKKCTCCSCC